MFLLKQILILGKCSIRNYPITATPHRSGVCEWCASRGWHRQTFASTIFCMRGNVYANPGKHTIHPLVWGTMGWLQVNFCLGLSSVCFCVGSTATKPSQCTGMSRMAFGGVDEEASQLLATRTRGDDALALGELLLGVVLGMLLCWEYGHQTFSMHGYVEDGFWRS